VAKLQFFFILRKVFPHDYLQKCNKMRFYVFIIDKRHKMKKLMIAALLLMTVAAMCQDNSRKGNQETKTLGEKQNTADSSIRIIFCGDLMGHDSQIETAKTSEGYDYAPCFQFIEGYLKGADLAIANLELTLAGPPYKGYPHFCSPDQLLKDAHQAGFSLFTTCNNHCVDRGKNGLLRTLQIFDSLNIPHLGTYRNEEERQSNYPLIMDVKGFKLAFLTYTYGTNGISIPEPTVVNMIDTAIIKADLEEAQARGAEYVIAMVHWGSEYQTTANSRQKGLAEFLLNHGADIVIGGHPHVVQNATMDALPNNDKSPEIVVYSMGNLISNIRKINADGGIMIELELKREKEGIAQDCWYMPYWVRKGQFNGLYQFYILPSYDARQHPEKYQLTEDDIRLLTTFDNNTHLRLQGQLKECSYQWERDIDSCSVHYSPAR